MEQNNRQYNYTYYTMALLLISLLPWLNNYISQVINVDIAFLTLSAERLLDGYSMSEAYYDTNLPLSIIIYIPVILISQITTITLYHAVSMYILSLLALATVATHFLLSKIPELSTEQKLLILATFLVINTVATGYDFGQKDHILGMFLFPFTLLQILITKQIKINTTVKWSVLLAGSLMILLKPHYGLIPAAIFLHRAYIQKRITIFKDKDFLCLSSMAIIYIIVIYIFFFDFVSIILPDIIRFYASDISQDVLINGLTVACFSIICAIISTFIFKNITKLIGALFIISLICIIPFILQGKGWIYHLLPAMIFFTCAFSVIFERIIHATLIDLKSDKIRKYVSFAITFISLLFLAIYGSITNHNSHTHSKFKNLEFTKMIEECADINNGKCPFLILNDMINMPHEISIYTRQSHASRFPYMWFAPNLIYAQDRINKGEKPSLTQQEIDDFTKKYTDMIAQDFDKYDPEIILVAYFPITDQKNITFNYRDYLIDKNQKFGNIWDNYNFVRKISIDRKGYMAKKLPNEALLQYDIYVKDKK